MAASLSPARPPASRPSGPPRGRTAGARRRAAVAAALLALAIAAPWLSAREVDHAGDIWRQDPDAAFDALDRAETFNPLSTLPGATAGTIALRLDRTDEAERHFREVLDDDPENAYAALELGLIASAEGDNREARRMLELALAQNPRDPLVIGGARGRAGREARVSVRRQRQNRAQRTVGGQPRGGFRRLKKSGNSALWRGGGHRVVVLKTEDFLRAGWGYAADSQAQWPAACATRTTLE